MKISKSTIIRTAVLVLVLINMVLRQFGVHPIDISENDIACIIELLIEILAIVCAWWYNNSFTEKARKADEFFKKLKGENKDV